MHFLCVSSGLVQLLMYAFFALSSFWYLSSGFVQFLMYEIRACATFDV